MLSLQMQNLCSRDFFKKTHYNADTLNQLWMSQIADSHDSICNCPTPFGHLLASIFPPGHQDRNLTITQILQRDYKERCHFGGEGERGAGYHTDNTLIKEEGAGEAEENFKEEDLAELFAAADAAEEKER